LVSRKKIRYLFLILTFLFALPVGWGSFSGISVWLSPFITLNSVLALKSFVILNIIGFVVLAACWFERNFFCRYICPVGCLLGNIQAPSRFSRKFSLRRIPSLGIWLAIISLAGALAGFSLFIFLDPISIFNLFFSSFLQTSFIAVLASVSALLFILGLQYFLPGLWCFRVCPLGGIQILVTDIKSFLFRHFSREHSTDVGRRLFIGSAAGAVAAFALPRVVKEDYETNLIRPPAALESLKLYSVCTRCGSCIKACPTRILKEDVRLTPGFLTPRVTFLDGYCLETCNSCSVVCPSGAITLFKVEAKSQIRMGLAEIKTQNCLLSSVKECDRCKAGCPYGAVEIRSAENSILMLPFISYEKCTGCGACMVICPTACISIIPSNNCMV
jgi:ferredoxin